MLIASWVPEKPEFIYGPLLGAALTLIGVWVTNRQSRIRQKLDLFHSAEESQKKRLHELRRDIYLPFSDAVAHALAFVPRIPTCPVEEALALVPIIDLGRQVARVSLIAPPEIIEPVTAGFLHLQMMTQTLLKRRMPIDEMAGQIQQKHQLIDFMLEQQKSAGSRLDALADSGGQSDQYQVLLQQHQIITNQIQEMVFAQQPLVQQKLKLELQAARKCAQMLMPLQEHTIKALLSIRREIELPLNEVWYREFNRVTTERAMRTLEEFQDEVDRDLGINPEESA